MIDFADFKGALRDLTEAFDHSFVAEEGSLASDTLACLEREGFSLSVVPFRTTAENFARYFYGKLADAGFPVSQVDVYETPTTARSTVASDWDIVGTADAGSRRVGARCRTWVGRTCVPRSERGLHVSCCRALRQREWGGRAAGKLAAFIRFTGCNLACSYCDTMWANAPAAAECAERVSVADLVAWARETRVECITLTGGEPALQPELPRLVRALLAGSPAPSGAGFGWKSRRMVPLTCANSQACARSARRFPAASRSRSIGSSPQAVWKIACCARTSCSSMHATP